ncbi:hypothetical protein LG204_10175 [Methylovorus menthalis]|uniref:toxin YdaT family protein n=1 Tax=Methylovorus menthalis TaxID=1002227 RepID=UPI001E379C45|nr:toxin YdaT family protein [Methylovorus menthalis]MCB4811680.1 hypothetical protein [Methylovorus menthalis]
MREKSQTTIAIVRHYIQIWRKREGWTREAVAQEIVKSYESMDGESITGLRFDPPSRDIFERAKVNADRIFRWLDDDSKDSNLLSANILPFLVGALPMDLRIECVNQILGPTNLSVMVLASDQAASLVDIFQTIAKEGGEAIASMAGLLDGGSPEEIQSAKKELTEAMAAIQAGLTIIENIESAT